MLANDPKTANDPMFMENSQAEMQKILWQRLNHIWLKDDGKVKKQLFDNYDPTVFPYSIWEFLMQGGFPTAMHHICGIAALKYLGSEEQNKLWMEKFKSFEIVTCYS